MFRQYDGDTRLGRARKLVGPDENQQVIDGVAFVDEDQDSVQDRNERVPAGVIVSNGHDVTKTDSRARYGLTPSRCRARASWSAPNTPIPLPSTVTATDVYGRTLTQTLTFQVAG